MFERRCTRTGDAAVTRSRDKLFFFLGLNMTYGIVFMCSTTAARAHSFPHGLRRTEHNTSGVNWWIAQLGCMHHSVPINVVYDLFQSSHVTPFKPSFISDLTETTFERATTSSQCCCHCLYVIYVLSFNNPCADAMITRIWKGNIISDVRTQWFPSGGRLDGVPEHMPNLKLEREAHDSSHVPTAYYFTELEDMKAVLIMEILVNIVVGSFLGLWL